MNGKHCVQKYYQVTTTGDDILMCLYNSLFTHLRVSLFTIHYLFCLRMKKNQNFQETKVTRMIHDRIVIAMSAQASVRMECQHYK